MKELAENLTKEFGDKDYAHAYMEEHVNMALAAQIKVLRESRKLTQTELAELAGMKQERISALEDVDYESWTIKTLRKLARAFDVHLSVSFSPFSKGILDVVNLSRETLSIPSRSDDLARFKKFTIVRRDGAWKSLNNDHLAIVTRFPTRVPVEPMSQWQSLDVINR